MTANEQRPHSAPWLEIVAKAYAATDLEHWSRQVLEGLPRIMSAERSGITVVSHDEFGAPTIAWTSDAHDPLLHVAKPFCGGQSGWVSPAVVRELFFPPAIVDTHEQARSRLMGASLGVLLHVRDCLKIRDSLGLFLHPFPGRIVIVQTVASAVIAHRARDRRRLSWLGHHLEASLTLLSRPQAVRAVLGPTGRIERTTYGDEVPELWRLTSRMRRRRWARVERDPGVRDDHDEHVRAWMRHLSAPDASWRRAKPTAIARSALMPLLAMLAVSLDPMGL